MGWHFFLNKRHSILNGSLKKLEGIRSFRVSFCVDILAHYFSCRFSKFSTGTERKIGTLELTNVKVWLLLISTPLPVVAIPTHITEAWTTVVTSRNPTLRHAMQLLLLVCMHVVQQVTAKGPQEIKSADETKDERINK